VIHSGQKIAKTGIARGKNVCTIHVREAHWDKAILQIGKSYDDNDNNSDDDCDEDELGDRPMNILVVPTLSALAIWSSLLSDLKNGSGITVMTMREYEDAYRNSPVTSVTPMWDRLGFKRLEGAKYVRDEDANIFWFKKINDMFNENQIFSKQSWFLGQSGLSMQFYGKLWDGVLSARQVRRLISRHVKAVTTIAMKYPTRTIFLNGFSDGTFDELCLLSKTVSKMLVAFYRCQQSVEPERRYGQFYGDYVLKKREAPTSMDCLESDIVFLMD
jgi:hypothetical protein